MQDTALFDPSGHMGFPSPNHMGDPFSHEGEI